MTTELEGEIYGDDEVIEYTNTKIPKWLWIFYIGMPLWAILWFWLYWDGSEGLLDRGHWRALEEAAHTTYPFEESQGPDPALDTPYIHPYEQ